MTSYTLRRANPATTRTDVVVIGVGRAGSGSLVPCEGAQQVVEAYGRRFEPMLAAMGFDGRAGSVLRVPTGGAIRAGCLVVTGLGEVADIGPTAVRRAAGVAARDLGNAASVTLALPTPDAAAVRAAAEGFWSGGYRPRGGSADRDRGQVAEVVLLTPAARSGEAAAALRTARVVSELADRARDWVNAPPNELGPPSFAEAVTDLVERTGSRGLSVEVLDEQRLAELGCGGILGVGLGSARPPRLARLTWSPRDARGHVALVGKGITYDSGGLTIKPGSSMKTMKFDMAGAAAVVAATCAVARLGLPVAVSAFAPMAENMPSGSAMRPGDVLRMYGGRTVEVTNTDAEGRLVLADALGMAAELEPDRIVEISTLTGPCVTALGDRIAGLFGDAAPVAELRAAAESAGELVWPMPITDRTIHAVTHESSMADVLQHNWVRWGSASWAAAVLAQFVRGVPFAHLDIAGPAYNPGPAWGHVPGGGTGFGVAALVEYVARMADQAPST